MAGRPCPGAPGADRTCRVPVGTPGRPACPRSPLWSAGARSSAAPSGGGHSGCQPGGVRCLRRPHLQLLLCLFRGPFALLVGRWAAHGLGQGIALDRDRGLGVHGGDVERRGRARVAEVVGQCRTDLLRGLDGHGVLRRLLVQHPLTDDVEGPRYAGADLSRPQRAAALTRGLGYGGRGDTGPPTGQAGVEDTGEVDDVGLALVELPVERVRWPVALEAGVDDVPDQLDRAGVGHEHGLGVQPTVRDILRVTGSDRVGHLPGQPGGARGRQRALLEHQVERDAVTPFVDHPGDAALVVAVEHAQQVRVRDGGRDPGRLEQAGCTCVVARDGVDRDAARQDRVGGAPETGSRTLREQVVETVAASEDRPGSDRSGGHVTPLTIAVVRADDAGTDSSRSIGGIRCFARAHRRARACGTESVHAAQRPLRRLSGRRRVTSAMTSFTSEIRSIRASPT